MSYDRQKVIDIAKAEVGYLEKSKSAYTKNNAILDQKTAGAGYDNYTKYGRDMHRILPSVMDFPAAWCDCFVDWCFVQAYGQAAARDLLCGAFNDYTVSSALYYKDKGRLDNTPEVGAQIFFSKTTEYTGVYHTGLVIAVSADKKTVTTIEGNTSATGSGIEANGGCVAKKTRSVTSKTLFGHPAYNDGKTAAKTESKTVSTKYTGTVNAKSGLMVRMGPGTGYNHVEGLPSGLPKGTKVGIEKEQNGWGRLAGTAYWVYLGYVTK